jgi:4-amino-4-deoxy-L-arabinose transferase-like glycosyltransferase
MKGVSGQVTDHGEAAGRPGDPAWAGLSPGRAVSAARSPVLWVLALALVVRVVLLALAGDLRLVMDETQYQEIAVNLVEGRGFMIYDRPTSWRPPLYPFALSLVYRVAGTTDPMAARVFQVALSLINLALVYLLGRRLFGERTAVAAALVFALYPSLLFYNNHLLTEVLFTCLLTLTAYCLARYLDSARAVFLAAAGAALALTVLTREVLWPMVGVMALGAGHVTGWRVGAWSRHVLALGAALLLLVTPWAIRNTLLQGTPTFVATNGGVVLYEGNYEHTPLDRPWRAHAIDDDLKVRRLLPPGISEGERQAIATQRALAFMRAHPGLTIHRSLVKMANVWGLEREVVGLILAGEYGAVGRLGALALSSAIFATYVITLLGGVVGLCFAVARRGPAMAFHLFTAVLVAFVTLAHALAFGHPRFHLPLMPLFALYAAHAWTIRSTIRGALRTPAFGVAAALTGLLAVVWMREIALESERFIKGLLRL